MPDHEEIARGLMERFPGWTTWHGGTTARWWALPPVRLAAARLLHALTPDELAVQIAQADPSQPAPLVLEAHTGRRLSFRIDEEPQPVRLARRIARDVLAAWGAPHDVDTVLLVVAELTTNAVSHGEPPITLALATVSHEGRPALLVDLDDASPAAPERREPGEDGGFGMRVVEELADMSVHPRPGGKTVRAVIPAPETTRGGTADGADGPADGAAGDTAGGGGTADGAAPAEAHRSGNPSSPA
jgi:anti-sigma regulatory factor (Ser/Thr protein kinase)